MLEASDKHFRDTSCPYTCQTHICLTVWHTQNPPPVESRAKVIDVWLTWVSVGNCGIRLPVFRCDHLHHNPQWRMFVYPSLFYASSPTQNHLYRGFLSHGSTPQIIQSLDHLRLETTMVTCPGAQAPDFCTGAQGAVVADASRNATPGMGIWCRKAGDGKMDMEDDRTHHGKLGKLKKSCHGILWCAGCGYVIGPSATVGTLMILLINLPHLLARWSTCF